MWLVVTDPADHSHYDFHCPGCGRHLMHPADAKTVAVLRKLVPVEFLEIPAEALEEHTGPVLTLDDLLDLALNLDNPDVLVR